MQGHQKLVHASRLKVKQQAEQDTQGNCGYEVWKIKNGLEQVPAPEPVLVQQKGQNQAEDIIWGAMASRAMNTVLKIDLKNTASFKRRL